MKTKPSHKTRLLLETLEARDVPSVSSVFHTNYSVTINCNANPSNVQVSTSDIEFTEDNIPKEIHFIHVHDSTNGFDHTYQLIKSPASKITFNGGSNNDTFSSTSQFPCTINGNGGIDTLTGGPLADYIYGGTGDDQLYGGGGNDHIYGQAGNDTLHGGGGIDVLDGGDNNDLIYGDDGNDFLYGGLGNDELHGGTGNDKLYGQAGADKLFGEANEDSLYGGTGVDELHGGAGSDFLDDGSGLFTSPDVNDGGDGNDFRAYRTVVNGTVGSDVHQYTTNTCWILSPLAATASAGYNLKDRITYLGNGNYRVKLFHDNGTYFYQNVSLEGGRFDFEPLPQGEESWVILFQRAILKQFVSDVSNSDSYPSFATSPSQSLPYITGRHASLDLAGGDYIGSFGQSDILRMKDALAAGKLVCAGSRPGDYTTFNALGSVSTPYVCGGGGHVYAVIAVNTSTHQVTLRNPWGTDVSYDSPDHIAHHMSIQGANDGIVVISSDDFIGSFAMMSIS